ncbi:MAG TPA: hypothetical protein VIJ68_03260 [Candidatus Saccharimonadales bacterium]
MEFERARNGRRTVGSELSLADANAAVTCLELKAQLDPRQRFTAAYYARTARKIREAMGEDPDIDGDFDTTVAVGRLGRTLVGRAPRFTLANSELITENQTAVYARDLNLLPNFGQKFVDGFKEIFIEPAVSRLMAATVQLQERL